MKKDKVNLTRHVHIRLRPGEYQKLEAAFKQTTKRKLSEYIRAILFDRPVTVYTRSQSMDHLIAELILLRRELSAIGSNFNQLVKRLHTASHEREIKILAMTAETEQQKFTGKLAEINQKIAQLNAQWLQE